MNNEILKQLKRITPEEQEILDGRHEIDEKIYVESEANVFDSKKLLDTTKLITVRPHTRFIHFPKHTHNYIEVIYMCSGTTTHYINGEKVVLQQGELLFLSRNAIQEIEPAGLEDIAVNFIVLPQFFDQTLRMIGEEENIIRDFVTECLRGESAGKIGYLHFRVADVLPIQNLVENLIWTIMNNQQNKRSINQVTMGLLFLQLMNHTDKAAVGSRATEEDIMLTVLRYVEENYCDGELSELAQSMHYDLYWLSRMIKKQTGKTYTELVQTRRLQQAVYLLKNTDMSVADIGNAIGYDNLSYFHRIFKEKYQVSPKHYRDEFLPSFEGKSE